MAQLAVIGAGYVGLTSAACLAHLGHRVVCSDVDEERVIGLSRGDIPIVEEGLADLVREGLRSGRLSFTCDNTAAVDAAEFILLCVPTPQGDDGRADMSYIRAVAAEIGPHLRPESIVINKSTVPVGSTRVVEQTLGRADVSVVSNPEFLREGSAVHDFLHPDRIVIGAEDESTAIKVSGMFLRTSAPLVVTDPASAETIKYASNAFLATKLSFVNALSALCEAVGADIRPVVLGMGYDRRIGSEFLRPGPGWGGSCLPKDVTALIHTAGEAGYDFALLKGAVQANHEQYRRMADKVIRLAGGSIEGRIVAIWGLTFKARTDDLRHSPSLEIAGRLTAAGARVRGYDPTVRGALPGIEVCADPYAACEGASVVVVGTEWDELRWLDFPKVAQAMAAPAILDCRNLLEPAALRRQGFVYEGVGLV
ncbi:MAG TPA: UDP-glucose/GDP-mannose dehydrogenase family protein [Acidimicrobiales bacterium]|nr:UDP-glucose/GDP-mannose dehydrogenase family protein [Acidimicrobiales bacterium]